MFIGFPDGDRHMDESPHPAQTSISRSPFQVGDWLVEPDAGRLTNDGRSSRLEPKVMDLLIYMAQRPGQVLPREELEQAIWTGTVVGYDALTSAIIKLRKAFGDDSHKPWLIETVAWRTRNRSLKVATQPWKWSIGFPESVRETSTSLNARSIPVVIPMPSAFKTASFAANRPAK